MFSISVLVALLSLGLLVGCGDSNNSAQQEVIDDILGGGTLNGCAAEDFEDLTGETSVTITDISAWGIPHSACIAVRAGTTVIWEGNFETHPLVGGETATTDDDSPITEANASGTDPVSVTFSASDLSDPTRGGAFPYFCTAHEAQMQGVIVVFP